ncbi:MAG: transcriptional regulator [Gammaproteobacteria bacterium]|nr:transcriptional regulator [Gammaproteobacteria bacterium]|tara:strand:- start:145 stop:354 length:210 start_codon:yes stop_codon:yes gene_type:complete
MKITLKNELKLYRSQQNLTQAKLGELAGITRKSINAIEANKMVPSVILALLLANVLNVTVEKLFYLDFN